jgi:hypothetical protein
VTTLAGCASPPSTPAAPQSPPQSASQVAAPAATLKPVSGVLLENFDRSVRPQDDFTGM